MAETTQESSRMSSNNGADAPQPPENQNLEKLIVQEILDDRRKERRWRNIRWFSMLGLAIAYGITTSASTDADASSDATLEPYAAMVRVEGEIGPNSAASAEKINPALAKAFGDKAAKGVVILVNSPGGTPVQATLIHHQIMRMRQEHPDKHVVVVGEDYLASGAYLLSVAAEKIYVSEATVTGSIGVISSGFGFDKAIGKLGIERRTFHAGAHKGRDDPYLPLSSDDQKKMQSMLDVMHHQFIGIVKAGRKDKLHGSESSLFSGDFWTGEEAVQLGLADGVGDLPYVTRKEFGVSHVKEYSGSVPLWEKLTKDFTASVQTSVSEMGGWRVKAIAPGF